MTLPGLFRELFRAAYWVGTIGLAISVSFSATVGAYQYPQVDPDDRVPASARPDDPDGQRCAERVHGLHRKLTERAREAFTGDGGPDVEFERDWADWSREWRVELHRVRSLCRLGELPALRPVARLADGLERLHLAYTTALHGFSDVGRKDLLLVRRLSAELGVEDAR